MRRDGPGWISPILAVHADVDVRRGPLDSHTCAPPASPTLPERVAAPRARALLSEPRRAEIQQSPRVALTITVASVGGVVDRVARCGRGRGRGGLCGVCRFARASSPLWWSGPRRASVRGDSAPVVRAGQAGHDGSASPRRAPRRIRRVPSVTMASAQRTVISVAWSWHLSRP